MPWAPLLVGVSRKSMIGLTLERPVGERLYGSLALAALAMTKGRASCASMMWLKRSMWCA
jgi:dihydropteroate synthase